MNHQSARAGDIDDRATALARLVPLFYEELRALARSRLRRERPDHSLQATALVHEAYLRLLGGAEQPGWRNREHFMVAAAEAMRRVLVDHARRRRRLKRGGGEVNFDLDDADAAADADFNEILEIDDALSRLELLDARAADVVRLKYFSGLSTEETAQTLGISERTVKREWAFSRAWLYRALRSTAS